MRNYFIPTVLLIFILLSVLINWMAKNVSGIEQTPLLIGNLALGLISFFAYTIIRRGLKNPNPNVLLRARVSVTLLKFFTCIALLLIYVFIFEASKAQKSTIFTFLGMYIIYSLIESVYLSKIAKNKTEDKTTLDSNGNIEEKI